jgi:hypothetical protein
MSNDILEIKLANAGGILRLRKSKIFATFTHYNKYNEPNKIDLYIEGTTEPLQVNVGDIDLNEVWN